MHFYASYDKGHHEELKSKITLHNNEYIRTIYTTKTGHILFHTDKRVFLSADDGASFSDISPVLTNLNSILNISVSPDNYIYISTIGEGVVKYNIPLSLPAIIDINVNDDVDANCISSTADKAIYKQKITINDNESMYTDSSGTARFYSHQTVNNFSIHNDFGFHNHCEPNFDVTANPGETIEKNVLSNVVSECAAYVGRIYAPKQLSYRCTSHLFQLSICNFGNIRPGSETFVELLLDPYFTLKPEENPDLISRNDNRYIVKIKNISQGECHFVMLRVNVSCDAPLNRQPCFSLVDVFSPGICRIPFIPVSTCVPFHLPKDHKILSIKYYNDENANCQQDPGEYAIHSNINAILDSETICPTVDSVTFVKILHDTSELTFKYDNNLYAFCQQSFAIEFHPDSIETFLNVPVQIIKKCNQIKVHLSAHSARRCFDNALSYAIKNEGSINSGEFEVEVILDTFIDIIDIHGEHQILNDSVIRFKIEDLYPGENENFTIYYNLNCNAVLGQTHCMRTKIIDLVNGCESAIDDKVFCFENRGSFDPNDKRVFINQKLNAETVDKGDHIEYMIRFQNTGTDTAFTVKIEDYISPKFDITSLVPLNASHEFSWYVENRILVVTFSNIQLVDSFTNADLSIGFVVFEISLDEKTQYGDLISNTASIFFDFNEPIITNESKLVMSKPKSIKKEKAFFAPIAYPNPCRDFVVINWDIHQSSKMEFSVLSVLGQKIKTIKAMGGKAVIPTMDLASGVYILQSKALDDQRTSKQDQTFIKPLIIQKL